MRTHCPPPDVLVVISRARSHVFVSFHSFALLLLFFSQGIDGVRIANSQELPQLLAVDTSALSRKDADGQFHYSAQDIVMGEVGTTPSSFSVSLSVSLFLSP